MKQYHFSVYFPKYNMENQNEWKREREIEVKVQKWWILNDEQTFVSATCVKHYCRRVIKNAKS